MNQFITVGFPNEAAAERGLETLKELHSKGELVLHGAGIVSRDAKQELTMKVLVDRGWGVAATGAVIGGLAGLGVGLLAGAILAAGGAVWGASAALTNLGAGKKLMAEVSHHLPAGAAAVVADVDEFDISALEAAMKAIGGTLRRPAQPA